MPWPGCVQHLVCLCLCPHAQLPPLIPLCILFCPHQDVLPLHMGPGKLQFDGIFSDTFGEHYSELVDFHRGPLSGLLKPGGIYSFFNGLAATNAFFHDMYCRIAAADLEEAGLVRRSGRGVDQIRRRTRQLPFLALARDVVAPSVLFRPPRPVLLHRHLLFSLFSH